MYIVEEFLSFLKYAKKLSHLYSEVILYTFLETHACVTAGATMWLAELAWMSPHRFFLAMWKELPEQNPLHPVGRLCS